MILATLALSQVWPLIRTVDIDGLVAVVASERSATFFAYQANLGRSKDAVLLFDRLGSARGRFDLPAPRFLVGTDAKGDAVLHEQSATITTLRGTEIGGSDWQPNLAPLTIRGDWELLHNLNGLVVLYRASPMTLINDVEASDAYGIDPVSSRIAVLRTRKHRVSLSGYDSGRKRRTVSLRGPSGRTIDGGYPLCSLEFIDRERILCALRLSETPPRSDGLSSRLFLCDVDLRTGKVAPVFPLSAPQGDLVTPSRGQIAVMGHTVAVASSGKLAFHSLAR